MAASKTFTYKVVTVVNVDPLKALDNALKGIASSMTKLSTSLVNLSNSFSKMGEGFKKTFSGAKSEVEKLTDALKIAAAAGAALWAAGKVWDFGKKVLDAARFRQTAISSMDIFYQGRGSAIFGNLINMANKTPADTKPLLEFAQQLSGSNLSERQLNKLTTLRADIEAAGASTSTMESMASVFMSAAGGGAPELGSDFIQKFLGKDRYVRYQAKAAGISDWETGNLENLNKKVNDARKSGKLSGTAMVQGLEEAALARMQQSKIGEMSAKMATGSIAGAMSNLSNVIDNMLFTTDFENIPGIKALVKAINEVVETLTGPEFQGALKDIITYVFSPFTKLKSGDVKSGMMWLLDTAKQIWVWLGKAYEFLKRLLFTDTGGAFLDIIEKAKDAFIYLGGLIGQGIRSTIFGGTAKAPESKKGSSGGWDEGEGGSPLPEPKPGEGARIGGVWYTKEELDAMNPGGTPTAQPQAPAPIVVTNNVTVNGDADPQEIAKAAGDGTTTAIQKSNNQKKLIKAGRAGVN